MKVNMPGPLKLTFDGYVMNHTTISSAVEIGRLAGLAQLYLVMPRSKIENPAILHPLKASMTKYFARCTVSSCIERVACRQIAKKQADFGLQVGSTRDAFPSGLDPLAGTRPSS